MVGRDSLTGHSSPHYPTPYSTCTPPINSIISICYPTRSSICVVSSGPLWPTYTIINHNHQNNVIMCVTLIIPATTWTKAQQAVIGYAGGGLIQLTWRLFL